MKAQFASRNNQKTSTSISSSLYGSENSQPILNTEERRKSGKTVDTGNTMSEDREVQKETNTLITTNLFQNFNAWAKR